MPVRIRLRRMGRKKQPHYRIVVADSASPRDGRFVETLGYYKPLSQPARLVLNLERVDHWIGEGALPSGTVTSLISKARKGGDPKVAVGEVDHEEAKSKRAEILAAKRAKEKEAAAAKAAEEEAAAKTAKAEAAAAKASEDAEAVAEKAGGDEPSEDAVTTQEVDAAAEGAETVEAAAEAVEAAAEEPAATEEPAAAEEPAA
ncbi:MAG: 30S ribosomal protein S16, partial [Gemmatimonadota bacterium]